MLKKTMLLASVVAALFALPAVASAAEWTENGAPLGADATVSFSGPVAFDSGENGGIACTGASATLVAHPGSDGDITKFAPSGCESFGPLLEVFGCEVVSVETSASVSTPWDADAVAGNVANITGIDITNNMSEGCLLGSTILVEDAALPVVATPDDNESISSIALSGEVETNVGPSSAEGEMVATPAATYGIE